jgi:DNA-binding MarR family transcriptional regulator
VEDLDIENQIVAAIRRIMRAVSLHSRRLLEEHGLTGPQLASLQTLRELGPIQPGVLAKRVHLSGPTVTGILNRLEDRGLVQRMRGGTDRRKVEVVITDTGAQLLAAAPSLLQDRFRARLARLELWELHMLLSMLGRIASMMDAEDLDAAPHLFPSPEVDEKVPEPD